ncbi:MAG: hypothetical protein HEQ38_10115 [Gemmatimonas sp.]|jgi:hypothetical protein|uniref:hypothetical protein n=1 Tax=Gemmatimonas sp. TaxID=1962908 RepID=UPI0031C87B70|nr:hypothetical protein [Gemmatimonas sp.]
MPEHSLRPIDVSERRILRCAALHALNDAANGSPAACVDVTDLAICLKANRDDVLVQLFVPEGLGFAFVVDARGARITARGVLHAERILTGERMGERFSVLR